MWAMVKNWVAMKNVTFQLQDVQKLAEENFSSITKDEWLLVCKTRTRSGVEIHTKSTLGRQHCR
jgi:hypothetical protein